MKVRALVLASQGKLRDCGIENPTRDARLMLANCLGVEVHKLNLLDAVSYTHLTLPTILLV